MYAHRAFACNDISFLLVDLKISAQLITVHHSTRSWVSFIHPSQTPASYNVSWRHILMLSSSVLQALNFLDTLTPNVCTHFVSPPSDLLLICNFSYYSNSRWCVPSWCSSLCSIPNCRVTASLPFKSKYFWKSLEIFVHTVYPQLHQNLYLRQLHNLFNNHKKLKWLRINNWRRL